ncbi:putative ankyrin repeat protein [Podospora conica]|nr:putative ankyrin repeat protein [Schizothecium conicum]
MACFAHLPVELLVFVADNIDAVADLASFARTDRKLYDIAIPILYRRAALEPYPKPLIWAAQHGIVSTLQRALAAGIDPNHVFAHQVLPQTDTRAVLGDVPEYDAGWEADSNYEEPVEHSPETEDSDHPPTVTTHDPSHNSNSSHQSGLGHSLDEDAESISEVISDMSVEGGNDALDDHHDQHADINGPSAPFAYVGRSYRAIHLAASAGHHVIVEMLLDRGADIEATAFRLCTCTRLYGLLNATECPLAEVDRRIVWTPLHFAICRSRPEMAKLLLSRGASHVVQFEEGLPGEEDRVNAQGGTALHDAARKGLLDVVQYLVDKGIQTDVDVLDSKTLTPLYHAVVGRRWDSTIPLLLKLGANINVDIRLFMPYTTITPMGEACRLGHFEAASRLLDLGADPMRGFTITTTGASLSPLHMCCMPSARSALDAPRHCPRICEDDDMGLQRKLTIQKLIEKGASVTATDCSGDTPLIVAAQNHNIPALEALLGAGASVRDRNPAGRNALMQAIVGPHESRAVFTITEENPEPLIRTLRILVDGGVPLDETDTDGNTLLHLIFQSHILGAPDLDAEVLVLRFILNMQGAAGLFHIRNQDGDTPLLLALQAPNIEACDVLVRRGCLAGKLDRSELEAMFDIASHRDHPMAIDFVLDLDVDNVLMTHPSVLGRLLARGSMDALGIIADRGLPPISPVDATRLLYRAIDKDDFTLAHELLRNGADPNGDGDMFKLPLCILLECWDLRCKPPNPVSAGAQLVRYMMDRGANPHLETSCWHALPERILKRAIRYNLEHVVEIILKKRPLASDPEAAGGAYLHTALAHISSGECSEKMVDMLLASGADICEVDDRDDTPLTVLLFQLALKPKYAWRYHRFIKALAGPGVDINRRNDDYWSAADLLGSLMDPNRSTSKCTAFLRRRIQIVDVGDGNKAFHFLDRPKKGAWAAS